MLCTNAVNILRSNYFNFVTGESQKIIIAESLGKSLNAWRAYIL